MNHVLIVDDEADIRDSLSSILADEGYTVTTAATATEALELIRDASYAVVLLDIWLPDRHGLDTLPDIRPLHARRIPSQEPPVRRAQLRRHPRGLHRLRALRLPPQRPRRRPDGKEGNL